jgi:uncharacterized protein (TIGR02246 family)
MTSDLESAAAALAARWEDAWNRHDMSRLDELATDDADWVTVGGTRLRGRAQVQSVHEQLHAGALASTTWTNDSHSVAPVATGIALLHLDWTVRGERQPDGTPRPPRRGVFSWLLVDDGGRWRIRAAHGTNVAG